MDYVMSKQVTTTQQAKESYQIKLNGLTMGTSYCINYIALPTEENIPTPQEIKAGIDELLIEINSQMSVFLEYSEISLFNKSTKINTPIKISDDFAKVVYSAININKVTLGGLDITLAPIVNRWGFGPNASSKLEGVASCSSLIGMDKLKLNGNTLYKSVENLQIDLSSIAKGFGLDKVASYLESNNITNYLIEIGGELLAKGKNIKGKIWNVAIEKPNSEAEYELVFPLNNTAIATSGNYSNYHINNKKYSHIINPQTLHPTEHDLVSLTVLCQSAMEADGLATGLYVLGPDKALDIAEKENIAVFLIVQKENQYINLMSSSFKEYLTKQKKF